MNQIIDVEVYQEAREWLKTNPDWKFNGETNKISHDEIVNFVEALHLAGCELIKITEYEWTIEPVYEGDVFNPDMLEIKLPVKDQDRKNTFDIINNSFPGLAAKVKYEDTGSEWLTYSFEPEPQKIIIGNKEIKWYS